MKGDKYKNGFALVNVKCANCAFDVGSLEYEFQTENFPLKKILFEAVEKLHDEDVQVQKGIYKCNRRKLAIAYCNVAEEQI